VKQIKTIQKTENDMCKHKFKEINAHCKVSEIKLKLKADIILINAGY
jgi:hypothetical protein